MNNADLIGNIVNAKVVRTILENGSLGPKLTEWFKLQGKEDQDALIYNFM